METLQPVLLYGRYEWQRELQPLDEFQQRLDVTRRLMRENGWDALVIYGDSRENAALCYLTNIVPNQRWSLALVDGERAPCAIASVGPRDLPSIKRLTWLDDVRASSDGKAVLSQWLRDMRPPSDGTRRRARIAISGLAHMRAGFGRDILAVCGEFGEVADAGGPLSIQRRVKSQNELSLLRRSYTLLQAAFAEVEARRQSGAGLAEAVIAAERTARLAGAQDFRSLSRAGRSRMLSPTVWMPDSAPDQPWSVHLAVRFCGYWTEGATTLSSGRCEPAEAARALVARALAAAQPSATYRAHGLSLDAEPLPAARTPDERGAYIVMERASAADGAEVLESATVFLDGENRSQLWPLSAVPKP